MIRVGNKTPLILEGGGDRGIFTTGVLDCFLEHNIMFPYVVGVSAGGFNALSYISKQKGRQRKTTLELSFSYKTTSFLRWLFLGNYLNDKILFEDFVYKVNPFDFKTFFKNPCLCEFVTTNCLTGKAMYLSENKNKQHLLDISKASGRLPFICPMVRIDGIPMLDGGLSDSIPLVHALNLGYTEKPIVILTQNKGYRKPVKTYKLAKFVYRRYPKFCETLKNRYKMYNSQLEYVEKLERENKIIVIRPKSKITLKHFNNKPHELKKMYNEGYSLALELIKN